MTSTYKKLYKTTITGKEIYIGGIKDDIYIRSVRTEHMFTYKDKDNQEEEGWTVDRDACEQKIFPNCTQIIIKDRTAQKLYMCTVKDFMQKAIQLRDRYFLPLDDWETKDDKPAFKRVEVVERDI